MLKQRDEVAKFLQACKRDSGFAKFQNENQSVMYTDVALRCVWENLYPQNRKKMEELVGYDALLRYLEDSVFGSKLGFAPNSAQNIFCVRAAASILSLISEVYPAAAKNEKDRFGELKIALGKAIREHQVTGTPLFAAYRPAPQISREPTIRHQESSLQSLTKAEPSADFCANQVRKSSV